MSCADCYTGSVHEGKPRGKTIELHGLQAYVTEPTGNRAPKAIIVILPDAFGWEFVNNRLLADHYADKGDYKVYLPDFMLGRSTPADVIPSMRDLISGGLLWKPYYLCRVAVGMVPFLLTNYIGKSHPRVRLFFERLRAAEGSDALIAAAGFCWGGKHVLLMSHDIVPLINAGFVGHPSFFSPSDVAAPVTVPVAAAVGSLDPTLPAASVDVMRKGLEAETLAEAVRGQVTVYDGCGHGFCVRADSTYNDITKQALASEDQCIAWFNGHFADSSLPENLKARLKASYDAIAPTYNAWTIGHSPMRMQYLDLLIARLQKETSTGVGPLRVVELGCGAGVPVTERLLTALRPVHVMANDLSSTQIRLARTTLGDHGETVEGGGGSSVDWLEADMMSLAFSDATIDAVVGFYSLIHLPRDEQTELLGRIARWLRPGGCLLANFAEVAKPAIVMDRWLHDDGWMFWSGWGVNGTRARIREAGFDLVVAQVEQDAVDANFFWVLAQTSTEIPSSTMVTALARRAALPPSILGRCRPAALAQLQARPRSAGLMTTAMPAMPAMTATTAERPAWPSPGQQRRALQTSARRQVPGPSPLLGAIGGFGSSSAIPAAYFQKPSLPANTIIRFVPQQTAWIVERMGKFDRILQPGLAVLIPFLDRIAYVKSLKEIALEIPSQSAITADNVTLELDGVLYTRVFDAYKASYGVEDAEYAISQLAQTTMRSEIGQMTLDHVLKERASLNTNITAAINEAAQAWGVTCLRYEIRDIHAPAAVVEAMHRQVTAERSKRAEILESEGQRQSAINIAEGKKQSVILASEALRSENINRASGESEAILLRATATAQGIDAVAASIAAGRDAAQSAVSLSIAEKYVDAFARLAKESTAVVVPGNVGDMAGLIATALGVYGKVGEATRRPQETARALLKTSDDTETARELSSPLSQASKSRAVRDHIVEDFDKTTQSR
ncbi:stomatin family protein [Grosmannia clavigera kw1407]|uniref:Stomatin family protein n=1 Tax=Grosmannia clavigera (strain kw1407 / UAMH 11150) TaxID=655863 RepID=F0X9T2_GROCL|nr:stomatin family protein [Grosmannia clavigera kw1407]EFX05945.1 stomatin family protein [Grosmannia clavigera kw1407]